jgi:hypothetical protein
LGGYVRLNGIIQKKREGVCPTSYKHNNFLFIGVVVPCLLSPESKKNGTSEGEINPLGNRNSSPLRRMLKNALTLSFVHRIKRTFPSSICRYRVERRGRGEKKKECWVFFSHRWTSAQPIKKIHGNSLEPSTWVVKEERKVWGGEELCT